MNYSKEKQIAIAAVTAAAQLCQRVQGEKGPQTLNKADTSPVTVADFGAQAVICQALAEFFPDDPVIGEEDAAMLGQPELVGVRTQIIQQVQEILPTASLQNVIDWINHGNGRVAPRYWTLDPIDGTKGFIRGDQYAIALALVEEGQLKLGILACPAFPLENGTTGLIFLAIRGQGSVEIPLKGGTPKAIKVDNSANFAELCRIESVESVHSDRAFQTALDQSLGLKSPAKQMDSLAKYGAIARGDAHLYTRIPLPQFKDKKENIWDHGPGVIIVEEAGGIVTDLDGKCLDFSVGAKLSNNRGILTTNGTIHQQVLEAIKKQDYK
ncbi:3'(2'),5'-bisphosphate nucleotidase [Crocosphaera sp. UHCC 0190]|uniref:3'(2'),5'-bisphosphate nucleotidase n=1 Tax=Crocosphaera sp. UHCC 0190 TaxID=3110246 RepID=UPI002B1F69FE|nr:3'(2'),5'-bisphosphate nucleotidase [Crocosphaera sp. UHCC 0190]MEA5510518.1 3'(2'),5'-bisphosphate nucleotidase [Crocosphaera sp. UHCC 0190]